MRTVTLGVVLVLGCDVEPALAHAGLVDLDLRRCRPAPGTTGSPRTIAEAVALANALPQPATAACFLEALDRPLVIEASKSLASAQPAKGARSPRLFLFMGESLVITAALDGEGQHLIEFGETVSPRRSVKGEIAFPLTGSLSDDAPYARVRNPEHGNISTCFVCHDAERDEPGYPGGRSSLIVRPRTKSLVPVQTLATEYAACDWSREPDRCAMLQAIVLWGPLEHRPFEKSLPTF